MLCQGITTETIGNCGRSAIDTSAWDETTWNDILSKLPVKKRWNGVKEYLEVVDQVKPAVNVAALFGHGDIRTSIVGEDGRPMTQEEKVRSAEIAEAWMKQGAFGVSSGLEYVPGRFADVEELVAVTRPVAAAGGIHASHIRNEGPHLLESMSEVIAVSQSTGVRLEVSHIKACGPDNWGRVSDALHLLDNSAIEASADFYPYLASSTELAIVLPDWVLQNGKKAAVGLLEDASIRLKAQREAEQRTNSQGGWGKIIITRTHRPVNSWVEGIDVATAALRVGKEAAAFAIDLLIDEEMKVSIARFAMSEDDLLAAIRHPNTCVVTDGNNTVPEEGKPHPRSVGTFPRVLGYYARDKGVISLEEAIRKMTSLPARKLRIKDRGVIAPGFRADLVIFDRDRIIDRATYENPWQYPEGIFAVLVNGEPALWEGELTGIRSGMGLRYSA